MDTQEKRACRREIINFVIQEIHFGRCLYPKLYQNKTLSFITQFVREYEVKNYGLTLPVYSQFVTYSK